MAPTSAVPHRTNGEQSFYIKRARIEIVTIFELHPFFSGDLVKELYRIRTSPEWREKVSFSDDDGKGCLADKSTSFVFDESDRILETLGYAAEMFRGIIHNDYWAPSYKINQDRRSKFLESIIDRSGPWSEELSKETDRIRKMFLEDLANRVREFLRTWSIKIKLTRSGLAWVTFESILDGTGNPLTDKLCAKRVSDILDNPYARFSPEDAQVTANELEQWKAKARFSKHDQVFTSYLYATAIWAICTFLKECAVEEEIITILKKSKRSGSLTLDPPWKVQNTGEIADQTKKHTPPLRNYCVTYLLFDVKNGSNMEATGLCAYDSPHDGEACIPKDDFMTAHAKQVLSLAMNASMSTGAGVPYFPPFSNSHLDELLSGKKDLSYWDCSVCVVESESVVIIAPSNFTMILAGQEIAYEDYWRNISKGLALFVGCKTALQSVGRMMLDIKLAITQKQETNNGGLSEAKFSEMIKDKLDAISFSLNRTRTAVTPSQVSRPIYVREKISAFSEKIGLVEIMETVSKDYEELNRTVLVELESQRNSEVHKLTWVAVTFTLISLLGMFWQVTASNDFSENHRILWFIGLTVFVCCLMGLIVFWGNRFWRKR